MFMRQIMIAGLMAIATFIGLALSAFAFDDPHVVAAKAAQSDTLDKVLTDKVETLLRTDAGLAGSRFRVNSDASVVTLSGYVPDEHALRRALELASGVRGVREVHNKMEIGIPN